METTRHRLFPTNNKPKRILVVKPDEREHWEDLDVGRRIILKRIIEKCDMVVCTGFIRIWTIDGQWKFRFQKVLGYSWVSGELAVSQNGFRALESVSYVVYPVTQKLANHRRCFANSHKIWFTRFLIPELFLCVVYISEVRQILSCWPNGISNT